MKRILSLLTCLIIVLAARAQADVSAITDKRQILIGEPFELQLRAVFPQSSNTPWFEVDSLAHFEILERSRIDTQAMGRGVSLSQTLVLTGWDSGRFTIPPLTLGGSRTKPVSVLVSFTPFDTTRPFHEIKDIVDVRKPQDPDWYWYIGFAVLALLLFLLFFPGGKKKEAPKPAAPPLEDPYRTALSRLEKLKYDDADPKLFYSVLTDILRDYLLRRRNIQSFSKTTDDLAVQIGGLGLPQELYHRLLQALRLSDLVKFARYTPPPAEGENARSVVRETIMTIEEKP